MRLSDLLLSKNREAFIKYCDDHLALPQLLFWIDVNEYQNLSGPKKKEKFDDIISKFFFNPSFPIPISGVCNSSFYFH
jgi:hypothetical protein